MTDLYGRRFELLINDQTFIAESGGRLFKLTFEVLVDFGGYNSYADIQLYNLSNDSVSKVLSRDATITLRAGYADNIDKLFVGKIKNVMKERRGPDIVTRIIARSGSETSTVVNKSLGVNTSVIQCIRECTEAMGYPLTINDADFSDLPPYPRGVVLSGDPRTKLDELAQTHKFSYVIDSGKIVVSKNTGYVSGSPIVISQDTGMEGIPEITESGCDVTVRLNPKLKIGRRIEIKSEFKTFNFSNLYFQNIPENAGAGVYRVFRLSHSGDTYGNTWSTKITGYR